MEDAQIVELYLAREERAIAYSAEKYGRRLRALSVDIVKDQQTAEECENDTYLTAWNSIPPHVPSTYLFPFLARITRHIAIDRCRERSRAGQNMHLVELTQEMEQCIPTQMDVNNQMHAKLLGDAISVFLRGVSEEQRNIFLRRYWFLDSVSAIAERFLFVKAR